jgi:hypothetical protein
MATPAHGAAAFVDAISEEQRRADIAAVLQLMAEATGEAPRMWGSIAGFGSYRYRYASGREGETFIMGLANRKESLVLHLGPGMESHAELLLALGKHKAGKGCLYIRRLSDVDAAALRRLLAVAAGFRHGV